MIHLPDTDLGETRTAPIPFTHRMDNGRPDHVVQLGERRYWQYVTPLPHARLVRFDVLYSSKGLTDVLALGLTVTLADIHGEELHRDIPLICLSPIFKGKGIRPRYFKPFLWDPFKSYITQVGAVAVNVDIEILCYFV